MKALNTQERNSSILKFSLWLITSVLIICVPVIFTSFVSAKQENIDAGENENLAEEIRIEKEYNAVKIQEIIDLIESKDADKIGPDSFNAELTNILSDMTKQAEDDITWRGDMDRNIVAISKYLISASKIVSSSSEDTKEQVSDLNDIIIELESCRDDLDDMSTQKKKKDLRKDANNAKKQLQRVIKKLNNYKSGIK